MSARIKIKLGTLEIEYEGEPDYLKDGLPELLGQISNLSGQVHFVQSEPKTDVGQSNDDLGKPPVTISPMTTAAIAAKLKASKGADLVIAACARLSLILGQESFSRAQILAEMKTATSYYEDNHNKNLSRHLESLVRNEKLNELSKDNYALKAGARQTLEIQLAN